MQAVLVAVPRILGLRHELHHALNRLQSSLWGAQGQMVLSQIQYRLNQRFLECQPAHGLHDIQAFEVSFQRLVPEAEVGVEGTIGIGNAAAGKSLLPFARRLSCCQCGKGLVIAPQVGQDCGTHPSYEDEDRLLVLASASSSPPFSPLEAAASSPWWCPPM